MVVNLRPVSMTLVFILLHAGVNDTGGHLAAGVVDTGDAPYAANIFASMETGNTTGASPVTIT
jgi:hypothetical protein